MHLLMTCNKCGVAWSVADYSPRECPNCGQVDTTGDFTVRAAAVSEKPIPCPYCRDLGRNARTGLACLHCVRGLAILNAELVGVRPESQTDRLTMAWRRLHEVQSGLWPAMSDNSRLYLERAMWEAERCLRDAIDHMADMETVEWLRRGKEERMRARLSATADQVTVVLPPRGS